MCDPRVLSMVSVAYTHVDRGQERKFRVRIETKVKEKQLDLGSDRKVSNPNPSQRTEAAETYQGLAVGATASSGRAEDHQRCRAHRHTTATTRDGQEPTRSTELLPPYVCGLKAPPPGHSTAARSRTGGARAPARGPTAAPATLLPSRHGRSGRRCVAWREKGGGRE